MAKFQPGLVHTPVTPFTSEGSFDYATYAKLLEFHLKHGADALAVTLQAGEPASLSDAEQRQAIVFAVKQVEGRVPVIAHAGDAHARIAADSARSAQDAGAAAIIATPPVGASPGAMVDHLATVGAAVKVPYLVYFPAAEPGDIKLSADQVLKLVDRLPNFAGVVDAGRDWPFMISILAAAREVRPDFQIMSATDFMVSAGTIGAKSMFSPLACVAPTLIRQIYDLCRQEKYTEARHAQDEIAALYQVVRAMGAGGLKGAVAAMGRDCGGARATRATLSAATRDMLGKALFSMPVLAGEPHGWG